MNIYEFLKLINNVKWISIDFQIYNDSGAIEEIVTTYEELKEVLINNFHFNDVNRDKFSIFNITFEN